MPQQTFDCPPETVAQFLVTQFALDTPPKMPDVASVVDRLEFVQEDSINICGRIHDLILWARIPGYESAHLHQALYESPRQTFEYYFPNLCVLPARDLPYFRRAMRRRASTPGRWGGLEASEHPIAELLLARMDAEGPLRTRSAGAEHGHATSGWGTKTTVAARVIEKLWLHGRLVVSHRENFERWFDRAERHLPELLHEDLPDPADEAIYLARKRLRTRRLFRLRPADKALLGPTAFTTVQIEGDRRPWHILAEDTKALTACRQVKSDAPPALHLLAPLDPLVYDRERNRTLFGFDYIWEVYTPAAKRRWGYYVLPILYGNRLVGRMDPKIDRSTKTLTIQSLTLEPDAVPETFALPLAERISAYARFLGAEKVIVGNVESEPLKTVLESHTP